MGNQAAGKETKAAGRWGDTGPTLTPTSLPLRAWPALPPQHPSCLPRPPKPQQGSMLTFVVFLGSSALPQAQELDTAERKQ